MTPPVVTTSPAQRWGQPCIRHIPVDHIAGCVWAEGIDVACDDYDITRAEALVACWWVGLHSTRRWRSRWRAWATEAQWALANGRDVDDPPRADT